MRRKGFTLVELLVVVGVIALLIAILMPSLSQARSLAKEAVCRGQLRQIGAGLATWAIDPCTSNLHNKSRIGKWVAWTNERSRDC